MARQLYNKLLYPSTTGFIWIIQNNRINKCDAIVRDIDVAQEIWGKDIYTLKFNTTRTKPNLMAGDMIKVPKYLLKLLKQYFSL